VLARDVSVVVWLCLSVVDGGAVLSFCVCCVLCLGGVCVRLCSLFVVRFDWRELREGGGRRKGGDRGEGEEGG